MKKHKIYDYLIVGAGFSGLVCAERLAKKNKKILLIDRRNHIAGNCFDYVGPHGLLIQKYGPHAFHTNYKKVWNYLSRFTKWRPYEHHVLAMVRGKLYPMPINIDTVNRFFGLKLNEHNIQEHYDQIRFKNIKIKNSEDVILSKVGRKLYEAFFKKYTKKQWGLWPRELDSSVCARLPVRVNFDDRYFTDAFQAMPRAGFTAMAERMIKNPNITLKLSCDFKDIKDKIGYKKLIFTGCVDEYYGHKFGRLSYRSLRFRLEDRRGTFQKCAGVNYTGSFVPKCTRITEFKHLSGQKRSPRTIIAREYSSAIGDPYYPILCPRNDKIYKKYKALVDKEKNVYFLGRLGEFKYYNIDQVCYQALKLSEKL